MTRFLKLAFGAFAAVLAAAPAQSQTIVVGGKDFTEQLLLTEMTARLLEAKGFKVVRRSGMGSQVVRNAQVNGQIDVYWEYTGTSLVTYNKVTDRLDAAETFARVKELDAAKGLTWLAPSKANNTYALAVRADDDKTDAIKTLSDLAAAFRDGEGLTIAVNAEFPRRPDGLIGLEKAYGFKAGRANLRPMESGLTYQALKQDQVDVALVFATDGRIRAFDFRLLEDDKSFFPDYALAPVVRTETLEANPRLKAALEALSVKLDDAVMQRLNSEVDVDKKTIEEVAEKFLRDTGLI